MFFKYYFDIPEFLAKIFSSLIDCSVIETNYPDFFWLSDIPAPWIL